MSEEELAIQRVRAGRAAEVARLAAEAVEMAADVELSLDYSEASIALAEKAVGIFSKEELSEPVTVVIVQRVGCYLLEVGRRTYGGYFSWWAARDAPVLVVGEPTCHIGLMTWDKVRGRLGGDKGDDLVFFYEGFAEQARLCTPGKSATYV